MVILNNSKSVTEQYFESYNKMLEWCHNNRVKTLETIKDDCEIYGYNTITHVLKIKRYSNVSLSHDEIFYILRRFDGVKMLVMDRTLFGIAENMEGMRNRTISNLAKTFSNDFIITDLKISTKEYIPNILGIMMRTLNVDGWKNIEYAPTVAKVGMKKEEFENMKKKLKIIGAEYIIVDLNTLLLKNNGKPLIYTRQKSVSDT